VFFSCVILQIAVGVVVYIIDSDGIHSDVPVLYLLTAGIAVCGGLLFTLARRFKDHKVAKIITRSLLFVFGLSQITLAVMFCLNIVRMFKSIDRVQIQVTFSRDYKSSCTVNRHSRFYDPVHCEFGAFVAVVACTSICLILQVILGILSFVQAFQQDQVVYMTHGPAYTERSSCEYTSNGPTGVHVQELYPKQSNTAVPGLPILMQV